MRKFVWRRFSVFESLHFHRKWRLSITGLKVKTFENAALSCGRAKTETFENGVDLKTPTCGRGFGFTELQTYYMVSGVNPE